MSTRLLSLPLCSSCRQPLPPCRVWSRARPRSPPLRTSLAAAGAVLAVCKLSYILLPLHKVAQSLGQSKRHLRILAITFFATVALYFAAGTSHIYYSVSYALIAAAYLAARFAYGKYSASAAGKAFGEFKDIPTARQFSDSDYEQHLRVVLSLAEITSASHREHAEWYIENHLQRFEGGGVGHDVTRSLQKLDNRVLAAYLYVKTLLLRQQGCKCALKISAHNALAKATGAEMIKAIDILIDEVSETTDKANSDISISLVTRDGNRTRIEVENRNDLVAAEDIVKILFLGYSLRTRRTGGLRKLNSISVEHGCRLDLQEVRTAYNERYLRFGLSV